MYNLPWILISIAILIVIFGLIFIFRKNRKPIDYYNLFIIGVIWIIFGTFSIFRRYEGINFFFVVGVILTIIGLIHRKEWKKNKRNWKMNKKNLIWIMIIFLLAMVLGILTYFFFASNHGMIIGGSKDWHECLISAGYSWCPSTHNCQKMWEEYCEEHKEQFKVIDFEDCLQATKADMENPPVICEFEGKDFVEETTENNDIPNQIIDI
jgi:hypothetical protein